MRIGVIGAMQIEIDNLKKSLENSTTEEISSVQFVKGNIGEVEVVAAVSGVGKVFAAICTEAMILKYQVDMVVNIGVAGKHIGHDAVQGTGRDGCCVSKSGGTA